jgi:hypothetical protein
LAHQQAMSVWTRKAQQSISQIASTLIALDTSLIPSGGGGGSGVYWTQALFDAAFAAKTTDNLAEGVDNLYWSQTLFDTAFAAKTTDQLPQGSTNLYWTSALFTTAFAAAFPSAFNTAFAAKTTDNLTQGSTNLYFTTAAARGAVSATTPLVYNSSTGVSTIQQANGSQSGFLSSADWTSFTAAATAAAAALPATKQTKSVVLCSAYSPASTGADVAEVEMPFDTSGASLTFSILRILLRVQTPGGAPSMRVELSTVVGNFSPTTVGTVTLTSGANEGQVTSGLGTIASGSKLRFNALVLGTAQNWTVQVDIAAN